MSSSVEAARGEVDRILQSRIFRSADVLRHLLSYLADQSLAGTADNLKEYTIGLDAFGKPPSFDPRQESVVRMHTARLRQKLAEYYRTEGAADPIVVDLPKGAYKLTFEERQPVGSTPGNVPPASSTWRGREVILAICLVVVTAFAVYFAVRHGRVEAAGTETAGNAWTPELRELWEPTISSSRPLVVCIATPLFVRIPGFGVVRESSVEDWDNLHESKKLSVVEQALQLGMSEPSYNYTGIGTASGAFLLGQFLAPHKQNVRVTSANLLSWPELTEDNTVFLGPMTQIHQTEDIPMDLELVMDPNGIRNLNPRTGEPVLIPDRPAQGGEESGVSHALISRIPGLNGRGPMLMLSGNHTSSVLGAVQAYTDSGLAKMLVSKLRMASGTIPRYFQVVLKVKSMDNVPVEISYLFHKELTEPHPAASRR